jgi:hypothetical protein
VDVASKNLIQIGVPLLERWRWQVRIGEQSMKARTFVASLVLSSFACVAHAQTGSGSTALEPFARCRAIPAAEARATCFDAAARALEAAVVAKDITIVSRQDVRETRRSLFGFTLPRVGLFSGGDDRDGGRPGRNRTSDDDFKEIETTITSARSVANGRVELRIAEGEALWVTTDPMPFPPKAGSKVRIRKGTMGTYFIAVQGERSVRGMRLR